MPLVSVVDTSVLLDRSAGALVVLCPANGRSPMRLWEFIAACQGAERGEG